MKRLWIVAMLLTGCASLRPIGQWEARAVGSRMCVVSRERVDVYALGTERGQVIHEGRGTRVRFRWPWQADTGTLQAKVGDSVATVTFEPWTSRRWTWYLDSGLVQRNC